MVRPSLPLILALVAFPATSAHAAVTTKKAIWGPVEIDAQSQFPVFKELGAGIYQTTLDWSVVADLEPLDAKEVDDPSYEWPEEIDTAIAEAKDAGLQVALTVTGTPSWSKKTGDFATFVQVHANRYPSVLLWSIWEGPYKKGPGKYAQIVDGSYAKLKAA